MRFAGFFCGIGLLLSSCGLEPGHTSAVDQIGGVQIQETEFPAVVWIGGCTGTFVSDTTLITAAHCVGAPNTTTGVVQRTVTLQRQGGVRSLRVLANPRSNQQVTPHDTAVVIFPPNTAKAVMPMHTVAARVGDPILLVGYGGAVWGGPAGTKRKGTNSLTRVSGGMLTSVRIGNRPDTGEGVAVAPGDSGGPLFINGNLAGIASGGGYGSNSLHVDLQSETSKSFLELAVRAGAVIPGFGGTPNTQPADKDIYASLALLAGGDDQVRLEAGTKAGMARVLLCTANDRCERGAAGVVEATENRRAGDRSIFRFNDELRLTEGATYTLAALDAQGKVVSRQRLRFSQQ